MATSGSYLWLWASKCQFCCLNRHGNHPPCTDIDSCKEGDSTASSTSYLSFSVFESERKRWPEWKLFTASWHWVWWKAWRGCMSPIFVKPLSVSPTSSWALLVPSLPIFLPNTFCFFISSMENVFKDGIEINHKITLQLPEDDTCTSSFARGVTFLLPRVLLLNGIALTKILGHDSGV